MYTSYLLECIRRRPGKKEYINSAYTRPEVDRSYTKNYLQALLIPKQSQDIR